MFNFFRIEAPAQALTCVNSMSDMNAAAEATEQQIPASTLKTLEYVQGDAYTGAFKTRERIDGGQLLDNLSNIFSDYQIPFGLLSKLVGLQGYALHIKIDDSGSMRTRCANGFSRWENVEQRLHKLINLLQFVPTGPIKLSFLDRSKTIKFSRDNKTPEQFADNAHQEIKKAFLKLPTGGTPIFRNIKKMLKSNHKKTSYYLLTDGTQPIWN